jgi:glycosyltransferase involved in cell wall biosynthesis
MAELGWDVLLIGSTSEDAPRRFRLGRANVLLVPTPLEWAARARRTPGFVWRYPLGYGDRDRTASQSARAAFRVLDLAASEDGRTPAALIRYVTSRALRVIHRIRASQFRAASRYAARPRQHVLPWRPGRSSWALDDPLLLDLELAFAPVVATFRPDIIHAHDYRSIGIAVRSARRLSGAGTRPVVVYDAHEFLPGVDLLDRRSRRGLVRNEAQHIGGADSVITVSDAIADRLVEEHGLAARPAVVLNVPAARWLTPSSDVRADCGLDPWVPLLVYCGVSAPRRGLDIMVTSLSELPGVHVCLVTKENDYTASLEQSATALGVRDRLHLLPYVEPDAVSPYLRTADLGVSPLWRNLNHDLTLPTKLFEFAQARLPIVTSDVTASAGLVSQYGIGTVFRAEDQDEYVRAVRDALEAQEQLRAAYTEVLLENWSWEKQAHVIDEVYRKALGRGPDPMVEEALDVERRLGEGDVVPDADVMQAASVLLDQADQHLADGDRRSTARDAAVATRILFHRALHFDGVRSPLAEAGADFLGPWSTHAVARRLQSPEHTGRVNRRSPSRHVAVLSFSNMSYVPPVEQALSDAGVRITRVDVASIPGMPQSPEQLIRIRLGEPVAATFVEGLLAAIGDADTLWVDWCQRAAVVVSALPAVPWRVIVRLHAFEAFTVFPHLVDWSAIDDLVFVGPHFQELTTSHVPGIAAAGTDVHLIPSGVDCRFLRRPKSDDARLTLAVVGWAAPAKDVTWAVDLLATLRARDLRYRLMLVGHEPDAAGPAGVQSYRTRVLERIARDDVRDAVSLHPFTDNVATLLSEVGVIVSSSVRESQHLALIEGAASGAVPVVRDWPLLAAYDGPRQLFPPDWVVPDVQGAAERVLRWTQAPEAFSEMSELVADETAERYDREVFAARILTLVRGPAADS